MRPSTSLFDKLKLFSPEYGAMQCNHANFPGESHNRISSFNNEFASFIFNEVITDDFHVCYGRLLVTCDFNLFITGKQPFQGMLFNLGDEMEFSVRGFESGIHRHGQYGLIYIPEIDIRGIMRKNHNYLFLGVGIRKQKHIEYFQDVPVVGNLIRNMNDKKAFAGSSSRIVPHEVKEVVGALARKYGNHECHNAIETHFLNTRMHEILNQVLKWERSTRRTTEAESQALERIHDHLMAHLGSDPGTLQEMGQIAGMSSNRMNQHFKERYGSTIFEYLRQKRREKTDELLRQNVPLQEIASAVGYSSVAHFIAAFKRDYGVSPGKMRR